MGLLFSKLSIAMLLPEHVLLASSTRVEQTSNHGRAGGAMGGDGVRDMLVLGIGGRV